MRRRVFTVASRCSETFPSAGIVNYPSNALPVYLPHPCSRATPMPRAFAAQCNLVVLQGAVLYTLASNAILEVFQASKGPLTTEPIRKATARTH